MARIKKSIEELPQGISSNEGMNAEKTLRFILAI